MGFYFLYTLNPVNKYNISIIRVITVTHRTHTKFLYTKEVSYINVPRPNVNIQQ